MRRVRWSGFVLCLPALIAAGCSSGDGAAGAVSGAAVVTRFAIEGGGFTLVDSSGITYLPENLPASFQQNGLRVSYRGHLTGTASAQQVGAVVHLDEVHALP